MRREYGGRTNREESRATFKLEGSSRLTKVIYIFNCQHRMSTRWKIIAVTCVSFSGREENTNMAAEVIVNPLLTRSTFGPLYGPVITCVEEQHMAI